jgi:hypothetical protein
MMVDPPAAAPLGAVEAPGAEAGAVVGTVAPELEAGEVVAVPLLHAAAIPATAMMATAMSFLECMSHLVRSRRTDRGRAV